MKHILISLMEPYQYVRTAFRTYTADALQKTQNAEQVLRLKNSEAMDYRPSEYLDTLIKEITDTDRDWSKPDTKVLPASTLLLMRHGMDRDAAELLTNNVGGTLIDIIATYDTALTFGNYENVKIAVCNEMDAMISYPPKYDDKDDEE